MRTTAQRFRVRATLALAAVVSVFFFGFSVPTCAAPASDCHTPPACAKQCARAPYAAPRSAAVQQHTAVAIFENAGTLAPAPRGAPAPVFVLARDTARARHAAVPPLHPLRIHLRFTVLLT